MSATIRHAFPGTGSVEYFLPPSHYVKLVHLPGPILAFRKTIKTR